MGGSCINWLDIAFDIHTIVHVVKVSRMITDTFCVLFKSCVTAQLKLKQTVA